MLRLFHIVLVLGNRVKILKLPLYSIQFLHQITTITGSPGSFDELYSIQFLHQITTIRFGFIDFGWLYSIQFLHQITTYSRAKAFWILLYSIQFLHQITTFLPLFLSAAELYSIQFLHQITTGPLMPNLIASCIVFNFYIKSQPQALHLLIIRVLRPYVPRKKRCSAN